VAGDGKESGTANATVDTTSSTLGALKELLRKVRRSDKDMKMRLAALHWSRALFRWDPFVLDTMTTLAGM
jgi:hypothetical protein